MQIEILLENAYKNNKCVDMNDILSLDLSYEEYDFVINLLNSKGIKIIEESSFLENGDEQLYTDNIVKQYLYDIGKIPVLTKEEEFNLFTKYKKTRDLNIRKKLIESNLKFVVVAAKRYVNKLDNNSLSFMDLVQEGNKGLMEAIDKYDVTRGFRFLTYAGWWIRQKINVAINNLGSDIRIPSSVICDCRKVREYMITNYQKTGEYPKEEIIAKELGYKIEYVKELVALLNRKMVSLHEPVDHDSNSTLVNFISSDTETIDEVIEENENKETINEIMKKVLTEREYIVLSLHYGFKNDVNNSNRTMTLKEIAKLFDLTGSRMSQVQLKALRKLEASLRKKGYAEGRVKIKEK